MSARETLRTDKSLGVVRALELILEAIHREEMEMAGKVFSEGAMEQDDIARCLALSECRGVVRQCLENHASAVKLAEHNLGQLWATSANEMKNRIARAMLTHDWSEVLP